MINPSRDTPPPIELRFVRTVEQLESARALMRAGQPLLLVFKAAWCQHCPAFGNAVGALATRYQFDYYYTDAADTELTEHYNILKLPAYVLYTAPDAEAHVQSSATPSQVQQMVEALLLLHLHFYPKRHTKLRTLLKKYRNHSLSGHNTCHPC